MKLPARARIVLDLFKQTGIEWLGDDAPQLGAALAYYSVFSLAPMVLLLLAILGVLFRDDPAGAWSKIVEQMSYFLDQSAIQVVQNIAKNVAESKKTALGSVIGLALALFGATGVFGQLQASLNVIWGVKAKPGGGIWGFIRTRFLSFALLAGIAFLLLVSLVLEAVIKAFSLYLKVYLPGALSLIVPIYLTMDLFIVVAIFAMIFKVLPNAVIRWRDVWVGALLTAILFLIGKWALGIYLGSGTAASAYGAASSLITLLLWVYYSSQILLFGAEFTQVYARKCGADIKPDKYAVRIERQEIEKGR
ncbi:MAG TPA: YihY/virulence factor BrkB family protein [Chthoniobacterales bacterium]|nr:YihY/virulence factor BrkB family protein [Chthoniobacterales bacterium]